MDSERTHPLTRETRADYVVSVRNAFLATGNNGTNLLAITTVAVEGVTWRVGLAG